MRKFARLLVLLVVFLLVFSSLAYAAPGKEAEKAVPLRAEEKLRSGEGEGKNFEHQWRQEEGKTVRAEVYGDFEPFRGKVRIKNVELKFEDLPPVIKEGRTLVPVRAIMQGLGAEVNWDEAEKKVTVTKGEITVVFFLGSREAFVNGEKVEIDVPAALISNRTFVPLRFLGEIFKFKVNYDAETGDVDLEEEEGAESPSTEATSNESSSTGAPSSETPGTASPGAETPGAEASGA